MCFIQGRFYVPLLLSRRIEGNSSDYTSRSLYGDADSFRRDDQAAEVPHFGAPFVGIFFGKNYLTDSADAADVLERYMNLAGTLFSRRATLLSCLAGVGLVLRVNRSVSLLLGSFD